jgi:hypothetical protein
MTSPFNQNVSDEELNNLINKTEEYLSLLIELKQFRSRENHKPSGWVRKSGKPEGRVTQVTCSCGHTTKYKVPLTTLDDFECPRKNRKEKK